MYTTILKFWRQYEFIYWMDIKLIEIDSKSLRCYKTKYFISNKCDSFEGSVH